MWPALLAAAVVAAAPKLMTDTKAVKAQLLAQFGEPQRERIERGVDQVAGLWRKDDGDLAAFVKDNFLVSPDDLATTLRRFEYNFEQIDGHLQEIVREIKTPNDL